jgi:hypothetical protein
MIWLPGPLVFHITGHSLTTKLNNGGAIDWTPRYQKAWHDYRVQQGRSDLYPIFIVRDILETPHTLAWSFIFLVCAIAMVYCRCANRDLKPLLFRLLVVTSLAVRCLSIFSGTFNLIEIGLWIPTSGMSFFKGFFLQWMVHWSVWKCHYLGKYDDDARSVACSDGLTTDDPPLEPTVNADSKPTLEPNINADSKPPLEQHGSRADLSEGQVTWRDAAVRLAYFYVVDNTIHVLWLRYCWEFGNGQPYTSYLNNSEILTMFLTAQVLAWIGLNVWTHDRAAKIAEREIEEIKADV